MDIRGFFKKHKVLVFFVVALLLRISLLFYDYSFDVNNHIAWAKDLHQRGFTDFYTTRSSEVYASLYPNYPPFALFFFYLLYPIQSLLKNIVWYLNITFPLFPSKLVFFLESRAFLAGMLKLPAIFADLGIAWICLLFATKLIPKNLKVQKLTAIFILFNPVFFFTSALWGQIDAIPLFFVAWSMYLLLYTKRYALSAAFFTFALLFKPTALVFVPLYLFIFFRSYSFYQCIKALFLALLISYASFIPFLKNLQDPFIPFSIYLEKIIAAQSLPFVTNGAFNFWVLVTWFNGIKDTAPFLFGFSYRIWGYFIVGFFTLLILARLFYAKKRDDSIMRAAFLISFAAFLFLTKMHERYSMLPLPFLLLASLQERRRLAFFIILSVISFFNLYHSWPVPKIEPVVKILFYPPTTVMLSLANLLLFFYGMKKNT